MAPGKILLLNLTRLGDLLQTQAAITALARGGWAVSVVCLENFSGAARLLDNVVKVFPLPSAALLSTLDRPDAGGKTRTFEKALPPPSWSKPFSLLSAWKADLENQFEAQAVCNLTPTLSSRLLARYLAGTRPCLSFAVDEHGFGLSSNEWAAFLQGAGAHRAVSPFNVTDLFRKAATAMGCGWPPVAGEPEASARLKQPEPDLLQAMQERLRQAEPEGCRGYVGLQLGASEERRRWPVESFAAVGQTLWEEARYCPILLGSKQELPLAEAYLRLASHPVINLCGATSLEELAAAISSLGLLVSNDTGTMHLGAGLGVPIVAIFLATAQPFDTGPYLVGSYSVEPDLDCHPCAFGKPCLREEACRQAVSPDTISRLALARLHTSGEEPWFMSSGSLQGRIWLSRLDGNGFMSLHSLSGHGQTDRVLWMDRLRLRISQFIDVNPPQATVNLPDPPLGRGQFSETFRSSLLEELEAARGLITLFRKQGAVLQASAHPRTKEKFLHTWRQISRLLSESSRLGALGLIWMESTQAAGQELPQTMAVAERFTGLLNVLHNDFI